MEQDRVKLAMYQILSVLVTHMIMLDHVWSWFMPLIYSRSTFRAGLPLISKVSCVQRELLDFVIYRSSRKEISALKEQFNCAKNWLDCSQTGDDGEVWEYWGVAQN